MNIAGQLLRQHSKTSKYMKKMSASFIKFLVADILKHIRFFFSTVTFFSQTAISVKFQNLRFVDWSLPNPKTDTTLCITQGSYSKSLCFLNIHVFVLHNVPLNVLKRIKPFFTPCVQPVMQIMQRKRKTVIVFWHWRV